MGAETKIPWCDHTFNSWRGCARKSEGCRNCYAEVYSHRNPNVFGTWGPDGSRVIASESTWRQPLAWDRKAAKEGVRRRVFCGSLMDVFEDRPDLVSPRMRLFRLIDDTPNLDWLLLTKRPENVTRFWPKSIVHDSSVEPDHQRWMSYLEVGQPSNVWLGVTVENQAAADERIPVLLSIPARVRFLSVEPMLESIHMRHGLYQFGQLIRGTSLDGIGWVIVGGESGPHARPFDVAWARSLRDQCQAAGTPYFFKQMGSRPFLNGEEICLMDGHGADPAEWSEDLRVQEFPTILQESHS